MKKETFNEMRKWRRIDFDEYKKHEDQYVREYIESKGGIISDGLTFFPDPKEFEAKRKAKQQEDEEAKRKADQEAAEAKRKADREAAATKRKTELMTKEIPNLIASMIQIPGRGYKMGKYEVTWTQWEMVMEVNHRNVPGASVDYVAWDTCQEFLKKLNALPAIQESGMVFRLPTEDEWEYACRAGATGKYCKLADGTEITAETLGEVAWFTDNSDKKRHSVGQKKPNAFGLYDMHGNVAEWTSTADGEKYVYRGGSSFSSASLCESSYRRSASSSERTCGLRLCVSNTTD